ncbi:hypothetical protein RRG08_020032 [Elysia crispata]|uniref:DUF7886 domain-containing protein n=1 Tax=Elysia crispata TaxID=231223 RepID=A0AAE1BCD6_9GAST|nr:hypothetical protein RRG08_020032 [Elysia crispata]
MDAAAQEQTLKRKLQVFLSDLQYMGTVAGFRHFTSYVRGREEMVLAINNSLQGGHAGELSGPSSRRQSVCPGDSLTSSQLPYDKGSLVLSHNTQLGLSGRREKGIGLPPASPAEEESNTDAETTLFLVAGYARYSCPYVWARSNHERLFKLSGNEASDRDSPLRLKSTAKWKDGDIHAIDIVSELVRLCTYPSPRNPFEVNLEYFQSLPQPEQLLASAAMVSMLQKIVVHTPDSKAYAGKVSEDLLHVTRLHFHSLRQLTETQSLPVLKQPHQQRQTSHGFHHKKRQQQQKQPHTQQLPQRSQPQQQARYPQSVPPQAIPQQNQQHRQLQQQQQPAPTRPPVSRNVQGGFNRPPTGAGYDPNQYMGSQQALPLNPNSGHVFGRGARGAFPGGFDRMPAPSLF